MNDVNEKIRQALRESGHNARWLALETEITESALSRYLTGNRTPNLINFTKICKALNLSANELLDIKPVQK